ncbi:hypothetical protein NDN08_004815 [Rhodosorus marinus]|uniref:Uncharacterized protein n=1 Tax=Rhodosorus marinus TaxID=101924 RepID=A0AAV8UMC7_9RHOD|nr:hypothetical protein NDN08_004815 [Rhodosorus marinus]
MGFGECTRKIERTSRARKREDARRCCRSFQWNFGSGVAAMFCWGVSATFKVTNVVLSELEPISKKKGRLPELDCSNFGWRFCACGHHFHDHSNPQSGELVR